jgi:type I restriction enzyme S subunit
MELTKTKYKQTEIGLIPEDWNLTIFRDIFKVNQGLQIAIEQRLKYPTINSKKYITIQYLNDGKSVEYIDDYSESVCCEESDVLMTRTGNTGMVITNVTGVFHNNFFKIKFDRGKLNKDYIVYFLRQHSTQKRIIDKAGTSTIPDLNHNDFYSLSIPLPPTLTEQKAIATAIINMDDLIANLDKLITQKKAIKQGAMQQLLIPPHKGGKRLAGFNGEWVEKKLGDVTQMNSGGTPSSKVSEYYNGNINWVSITDMTNTGKYINSSGKKITEKGLQNSSARLFPADTVLLAMYASIGKCTIAKAEVTTSQAILGITVNNYVNIEFLYYYLQYKKYELIRLGQQGTQSNLNKGIVKNIIMHLPLIKEQNAIAEILSDMDAEIEQLRTKRAKYQNIKQGMMQELLTGKTRLV